MEVLTILLCVALVVVVLAMVLKYFPDMRYPTLEMVPMYYFRDLGLATAPDTPGAEARSKIQAWFDTRSLPRPQVAVATSRESKGLGQPDYMKDNTYYRFVLNGRWYELGGSWQRLSLHEAEPMITFVSTGAQLVGAVNTVGKWIWHLLNNKLVRGTCVSFLPMFDRPSGFNFCQEQDQMPVHLVCEELVKRNPKCKLSMYGGCKGASVLLATLAHYGKMHKDLKRLALSSTSNNLYQWIDHIVALVCESPVLSVAKYMRWQWGGKFVMDHMIEYCYSNNSHHHSLLEIKDFPNHFPCLIGTLPNDKIGSVGDMLAMANVMNGFSSIGQKEKETEEAEEKDIDISKKSGKQIEKQKDKVRVWISQDMTLGHGWLSKDSHYWPAVHEFYDGNCVGKANTMPGSKEQ